MFSAKPFEEKEGQVNVYELKSKLYTKAVIKALPKKSQAMTPAKN